MQLADMDGLYEKIEEAVEERNQEGSSKLMILAAEDDALKREIEDSMHRKNSENLLALHQQLDTNVMYDPATRTGIVCVNGRCITNTPGGKNTVIQEERLGTMRPGPKPKPAGAKLIDQDGTAREYNQESTPFDGRMGDMLGKDDVSDSLG